MFWFKRTRLPDPVVGQVWRSRHSGKFIQVKSVEVTDWGELHWQIDSYTPTIKGPPRIAQSFHSLREWRRMLKDEARELIDPADFHIHWPELAQAQPIIAPTATENVAESGV